ncbi:hypothetical protein ACWZEH_11000 [Streptomyces sp. QTS137]
MPEPGGVYDDSDRPPNPGPLRQARLEQEYSEAFAEWDGSEDARLWDQVSGDGITGQVG